MFLITYFFQLRGRVRPYHVALSWLPPDDDGGLPVSAYRLEVLMPRLPSPLLRQSAGLCQNSQQQQQQQKKENSNNFLQVNSAHTTPTDVKLAESKGPICWPWVIGTFNSPPCCFKAITLEPSFVRMT